jgi:hypothetical protein
VGYWTDHGRILLDSSDFDADFDMFFFRKLVWKKNFIHHGLSYGYGSKPWYLVSPKIAGIYGCSSH